MHKIRKIAINVSETSKVWQTTKSQSYLCQIINNNVYLASYSLVGQLSPHSDICHKVCDVPYVYSCWCLSMDSCFACMFTNISLDPVNIITSYMVLTAISTSIQRIYQTIRLWVSYCFKRVGQQTSIQTIYQTIRLYVSYCLKGWGSSYLLPNLIDSLHQPHYAILLCDPARSLCPKRLSVLYHILISTHLCLYRIIF